MRKVVQFRDTEHLNSWTRQHDYKLLDVKTDKIETFWCAGVITTIIYDDGKPEDEGG